MYCSCVLFKFCPRIYTCESGEVGVFISMEYTDVNVPAGQVSWDIQDGDGNVLEDLNYLPIASNFIYTSDEICLPEGRFIHLTLTIQVEMAGVLVLGMSFLFVEEIQQL